MSSTIDKLKADEPDARLKPLEILQQETHGKLMDSLVKKQAEKENEILKDLEANHVKIEPNIDYMWYEWTRIRIDLPAVWNFQWYKFDGFATKEDPDNFFDVNSQEERQKLQSIDDVKDIPDAVMNYMEESLKMNHWKQFSRLQKNEFSILAWLGEIAWLDYDLLLSDLNLGYAYNKRWFTYSFATLSCSGDRLGIIWQDEYNIPDAYFFKYE